MLPPILMNKNVASVLSAIDDRSSMVGLAFRDGLDNTGRIYQEYKRSAHGGREQAVNEIGTTLVWGFGIPVMKWVYDVVAKTGIAFPHFNINLLDKGAQQLTKEVVNTYAHSSQKQKLLSMLAKPTPYLINSPLRFILTATVPAAFLGFGLPALNHLWTSDILKQEQLAMKSAIKMSGTDKNPTQPARATDISDIKPRSSVYAPSKMDANRNGSWGAQMFSFPSNPDPLPWSPSQYGQPMYPNAYGMAAYGQPYGAYPRFNASASSSASTPNNTTQQTRFGSTLANLSRMVNGLFKDERLANLVAMDVPLSGGRIYSARNTAEQVEWIFRELSIIAFVYLAASVIQDKLQPVFNRFNQSMTHGDFHVIQNLHRDYAHNPQAFVKEAQSILKPLGMSSSADLAPILTSVKKRKANQMLAIQAESAEARLVKYVRDVYAKGNGQPNLLLKLSESMNWIPVLREASPLPWWKRVLGTLSGKTMPQAKVIGLDLSRRIDVEKMVGLAEYLEGAAAKVAPEMGTNTKAFAQLMKRSMIGKFGAMAVANTVCFLALSFVVPKVQHWITYKMTGSRTFPGVDQELDRKGFGS